MSLRRFEESSRIAKNKLKQLPENKRGKGKMGRFSLSAKDINQVTRKNRGKEDSMIESDDQDLPVKVWGHYNAWDCERVKEK